MIATYHALWIMRQKAELLPLSETLRHLLTSTRAEANLMESIVSGRRSGDLDALSPAYLVLHGQLSFGRVSAILEAT